MSVFVLWYWFIMFVFCKMIGLIVPDPQAEFFRIYGWLIKIYDCFSAKPQNCGEGNLWLKILNLWLLFG